MNEFVIVSDSTVDLPKEYLQSKQVPIISLSYIMDGVTYEEMDGLSHKEFFEKLRAGSLPTTSQINPEQAREALESFAKEGKDILYIGFSSGLSGSYNSVRMAAEDLKEEYPDINIITIDSLCACMGEGSVSLFFGSYGLLFYFYDSGFPAFPFLVVITMTPFAARAPHQVFSHPGYNAGYSRTHLSPVGHHSPRSLFASIPSFCRFSFFSISACAMDA